MPLKAVPAELQAEFFLFECHIHSKNATIDYAAVARSLNVTETKVKEWYKRAEETFSQYDARTFPGAFGERLSARSARNQKSVPVTPKKPMRSFDPIDDLSNVASPIASPMASPMTPKQKPTSKRGIKRKPTSMNLLSSAPKNPTEVIDLCSDNEVPPSKKVKTSNSRSHQCENAPPCPAIQPSNYLPPSCEPGSLSPEMRGNSQQAPKNRSTTSSASIHSLN